MRAGKDGDARYQDAASNRAGDQSVRLERTDDVSLTGQLDDRSSPVGMFFRETFPLTRSALREFRQALGAPLILRLSEDAGGGVFGQIGTAVDYRIRYHFAHTPWTELAAVRGAAQASFLPGDRSGSAVTWVPENPVHRVTGVPPEAIDEPARDYLCRVQGVSPEAVDRPTRIEIGPLPSDRVSLFSAGSTDWVPQDPVVPAVFLALEQAVEAIAPHRRIPGEAEERTLARFCLVLSAFEAACRSRHPSAWPPPYFGDDPPGSVDDLLALVPDDWVEDAAALGAAFARSHSAWQGADTALNPSFAGSEDVGGADADLIVDGTLWDIKTTKRQKARGLWLHQLLGYALLDYDDRHAIDRVGFVLTRQDTEVSWPIGEFIAAMSGCTDLELPDLRERMRQVCESGSEIS